MELALQTREAPPDGATLDLIIPYLVNTPFERRPQHSRKQTRFLPEESRQETPHINRSSQLAKVYAINRGHSKTTHRFNPFSREEPGRKAALSEFKKAEETSSNTNELKTPNKQSITGKNSGHFFKVKSLSKGFSPLAKQAISSKKMTRTSDDQKGAVQEILGVKFRSTHNAPTREQEEPAPGKDEEPSDSSQKSPVFQRMRSIRERRAWTKNRSENVEAIVSRNCLGFEGLMEEYRRRMELSPHCRVFVFDSADSWLKRALVGRGWVQNRNKQSKAYHFAWRSMLKSGHAFPEQTVNHYPKGHLLTSKEGLHSTLKKHRISHLQPETYDLIAQADQFQQKYKRNEFAGGLRHFLKGFVFEKAVVGRNAQQLEEILGWKYKAGSEVEKMLKECLTTGKLILKNMAVDFDARLLPTVKAILSNHSEVTESTMQMVRTLREVDHYLRSQQPDNQRCMGMENTWILKSRNSSKGAGLLITRNLPSILKQPHRLVQKYIEHPLILRAAPFRGRKFDLRVWVLLCGSEQGRLFYHRQYYGKVSSSKYTLQEKELGNERVHLTNYNANRQYFHSKEVSNSIVTPQQLYQAISEQLAIDYQPIFSRDILRILEQLKPVFLKDIAPSATQPTLQLFGLDFLLDQTLQLHLMEVNLSASCSERHPHLTYMLNSMAQGIVSLAEDPHCTQLGGWLPL